MKIDVSYIIRDHLRTLRNAEKHRISAFDILLFYILPIAIAVCAYYFKLTFKKADVYNVSITFFGIFIALLLNLQVAIFAILQRRWEPSEDERMQPYQKTKFDNRRILLSEVNANLSYLVLFCCFALFAELVFYIREWLLGLGPSITVFIYTHFIFTMIMIVKRSHVLFQSEYGEDTAS